MGVMIYNRTAPIASPAVLIMLSCLCGAVLAQTFQYSRGWTNGKKRNAAPLHTFQDADAPDTLGLCQMMRLQEMMGNKRRDQQLIMPCEIISDNEPETIERYRRKASENDSTYAASYPCKGQHKCHQSST